MKDFPHIEFRIVDADVVKKIAGQFQIYTVPALLLFADGKEVLREARIVHIDIFREKIQRIYEAILG